MMKKQITLTVPQMDAGNDISYTTTVDRATAIDAGARALDAANVGRSWYYRAEETDEIYRLTETEIAAYGAGQIDDRGVDYSLWCSVTGTAISRPTRAVRAALGIE